MEFAPSQYDSRKVISHSMINLALAKTTSDFIMIGVSSLIFRIVLPKIVFISISFDPSVRSMFLKSITELPKITLYSLNSSFCPSIILSLKIVVFPPVSPCLRLNPPNSNLIPPTQN